MNFGAKPCTIPYAIIQLAKKALICQCDHCNCVDKNTGKATTNHTSLAANKNKRAADKQLICRVLENKTENFGFDLDLPKLFFSDNILSSQTIANATTMASTACWKPSKVSNKPPRKNPTPFKVFLEPVKTATQRYKLVCCSSGTNNLIALLALILFRSLAIPDKACAPITQITVNQVVGTSKIDKAITWRPKPRCIVWFNPQRDPSQPPNKLVTTPKTS